MVGLKMGKFSNLLFPFKGRKETVGFHGNGFKVKGLKDAVD